MSGYREIVTVAPMGKQAPDALRVTESVARRFASNVHFVHGLSQAAPNIGWTAESEGDLKRLRAMLEEDGRRLEAERQTVAKTVEEWRAEDGRRG